jgi:hypothetical protein
MKGLRGLLYEANLHTGEIRRHCKLHTMQENTSDLFMPERVPGGGRWLTRCNGDSHRNEGVYKVQTGGPVLRVLRNQKGL